MSEDDRVAIRAHLRFVKEEGAKLFFSKSFADRLKAGGLWDDEVCVVDGPIPVSDPGNVYG